MKKISCYKIKDGKQTKIPVEVCLSQKKIDAYLDKGYTIGKITEIKTKSKDKTEIKTFSPLTRAKACKRKGGQWDSRKKACYISSKISQDIINKFKNIKDDVAINLIDADDRSKDRVLLEMEWLLEEMEGK